MFANLLSTYGCDGTFQTSRMLPESFSYGIRHLPAAMKVGMSDSRTLVCQRNYCCIRQVPSVIKVSVRDSRALVCQRNHCCIRQVPAATKVGVRDSRALGCQRNQCCIRRVPEKVAAATEVGVQVKRMASGT